MKNDKTINDTTADQKTDNELDSKIDEIIENSTSKEDLQMQLDAHKISSLIKDHVIKQQNEAIKKGNKRFDKDNELIGELSFSIGAIIGAVILSLIAIFKHAKEENNVN